MTTILINALSARQGGGQTYILNLLRSMPAGFAAKVFLLAPDSLFLAHTGSQITRIRVNRAVENPLVRAVWERLYLPRLLSRLNVDVLFCPGGIIGNQVPAGCKSVTMFRNMLPLSARQRERYRFGYMRVRNFLLAGAITRSTATADRVICISEFARQVLDKESATLSQKTAVIPHGIHPMFRDSQCPRPHWLPPENYLLYVSVLDVYKAQLEVVRAFALLKKRRPTHEKLILAGPERQPYAQKVRQEIARLGLTADVLLTGPVPHDDLPALYRHALINVFASECENCPNILLEALASGRPLLASHCPPMPEFGGTAAMYFNPSSPEDLATKLLSIIDDPDRLAQMSVAAREQSLLYDWLKTAQSTWELIHSCAS